MEELSVDAILAADDRVIEAVPVPEWGGMVYVKSMTGTERDAFEQSMRRNGELDLTNARAKLLVRTIVNQGGTQKFSDAQAPALGKKNAAVLSRLYDVAARLSGMSDEAQEEMEGNSEMVEAGDASS
jgi:hypothetical protein